MGKHFIIVTMFTFPLTDGPGQAVISEGGAGNRGNGPGAGQVNGMPSKKSNSTSKLSAKGQKITFT